ncbi:MAG: PRC-barrel domain-containing protein [Methanomassiliicoccaceae archaeon]|nr:PRC-barrel domain-containing protein [Methanomassiliicoccaceae archaeon]
MGDRAFSREILGRDVETATGRAVGVLEDIVIDTGDGSIKYLIVATAGNVTEGPHRVDERGRAVVETDRIRLKGDKIVIN